MRPTARLAIVGPDDEGLTPALRALAGREGVAESVVFTGMLRGDDKLDALAAADVWALPSHTENFGNAVVEALAAGRAAVISPAVNIAPEIAAAGAGVVAPLTRRSIRARDHVAAAGMTRGARRSVRADASSRADTTGRWSDRSWRRCTRRSRRGARRGAGSEVRLCA